MKILGITAEYNPFHRGHQYHLEQAKEITGADITLVAMSGDFTQRGEPAIEDKWKRSKDAVQSGADLVFELPFLFACNRAPYFAAGGVDHLIAAGATHISFGCEADDPADLLQLAADLQANRDELRAQTQANMQAGVSYAKAYESATAAILGEDAAGLILQPNNILAVEYLKRIGFWNEQGKDVVAVPVKRTGSGYRDSDDETAYAGASFIRQNLGKTDVRRFLTEETAQLLLGEDNGRSTADDYAKAKARYFDMLKAALLRSDSAELRDLYCIGEGLENRFLSEIAKADSLDECVSGRVSKRYTAAAVQRMMTYILMGLKKETADRLMEHYLQDNLQEGAGATRYMRILAASRKGRDYIKTFKKENNQENDLQIITNRNKQMPSDPYSGELLELDGKAADLYNALFGRRLYDSSDKVLRPYIES